MKTITKLFFIKSINKRNKVLINEIKTLVNLKMGVIKISIV